MKILCALAVLAMAACSGGGGDGGGSNNPPTGPGPTPPGNNPPPSSATVQAQSSGDGYGGMLHTFSPTQVTISAGGSVTWSNSSGVPHNVTFASGPSSIPDFSQGSQSRSFPSAGNFSFSCTNHAGMNGTVVVQ